MLGVQGSPEGFELLDALAARLHDSDFVHRFTLLPAHFMRIRRPEGWRACRLLRQDGTRMSHPVCPWWLGYLLLLPIRRIRQNPRKLLGALVREGMTVLEPGPGMGFFSLDLARMVGPGGRVVAVDLQERMVKVLSRRALKAGLADRIDIRRAEPDRLGVEDLAGRVDLVLAIFVV